MVAFAAHTHPLVKPPHHPSHLTPIHWALPNCHSGLLPTVCLCLCWCYENTWEFPFFRISLHNRGRSPIALVCPPETHVFAHASLILLHPCRPSPCVCMPLALSLIAVGLCLCWPFAARWFCCQQGVICLSTCAWACGGSFMSACVCVSSSWSLFAWQQGWPWGICVWGGVGVCCGLSLVELVMHIFACSKAL